MAFFSSALASTIKLFVAGSYYDLDPKQVNRAFECAATVLASMMNNIDSLTDRCLPNWSQDRYVHYIDAAAPLLMTGCFKAALLFSAFLLATHASSTSTSSQRPRIKNDCLVDNSFNNSVYLSQQLFPSIAPTSDRTNICTAHLYTFPGGFFVLLADNRGDPFFLKRLGSCDSTEVCKVQEAYPSELRLSEGAMQRLRELGQRVSFEGNIEQWMLEDTPPFICIKGKWNEYIDLHGAPVDWEELITTGAEQHHQRFQLTLIPATWNRRPATPGLRGFNFNLIDLGFNIWVHEKNIGSLQSESDDLKREIKQLKEAKSFLREFENAAFNFSTQSFPLTRKGVVDWNILERWGNLSRRIPFPLTRGYPDLVREVRDYKRQPSEEKKLELEGKFRDFFFTLPLEAHFSVDAVLAEEFQNCWKDFEAFVCRTVRGSQAASSTSTAGSYIDSKSLRNWQSLLKRAIHHFGTDVAVEELIQNTEEYLKVNDQIRNRSGDQTVLSQRRTELNPILKDGYGKFFRNYAPLMRNKGEFIRDLKGEIKQKKTRNSRPRSSVESTAQIAYYSPLNQTHLYMIIRRNHAYQILELIGTIQSHLNDHKNDCDLPDEFCRNFNAVLDKAKNFLARKKQYFSPIGFEACPDRTSDPSLSLNARRMSRSLDNIYQRLSNLYSLVNQRNKGAYLQSSFVMEEAQLLIDLYAIANEMLFQLKIPMGWRLHRELQKNTELTRKALKAVAEGGEYKIYKRISNDGTILWDIVRGKEKSELEKQDVVHASINDRSSSIRKIEQTIASPNLNC